MFEYIMNFLLLRSVHMKTKFKKIALFGLVTGLACLSAQEAQTDSRELSMATPQGKRSRLDECRGDKLGQECHSRSDDYDYDVYTGGYDDEEGASEKRSKSSSRCNENNKRKSAAKVAQE